MSEKWFASEAVKRRVEALVSGTLVDDFGQVPPLPLRQALIMFPNYEQAVRIMSDAMANAI